MMNINKKQSGNRSQQRNLRVQFFLDKTSERTKW